VKEEEFLGDFSVYEKIWKEAQELRRCGSLMRCLEKILCSITAFHGEWDPHPKEGVFDPLTHLIRDFKGIILKKCGILLGLNEE